ncbi:MAG: toll/interleukin-1 receptor domain-containing protein [Devosia sp.]
MPKSDQSLKVFISYARRDGAAFAEELVDALDVAGFDAFLDRNDIAAGEDWEKRLEGLISAADTIVFVVTPGSIGSAQCAWEIKAAEALSKRVIPVVAVEVPDADAPSWLARLNYIFFNRGQSFSRALKQLAVALTTDSAWIREHTRFGELAERWIQRGRPDVLLLRGPELDAARHWVAAAKDNGPQPTDLQRSFVDASGDFENSQSALEAERLAAVGVEQAAKEEVLKRLSMRTRLGLIASGTLAIAAIGLAIWSVNAEGRFRQAQAQAREAEQHSVAAEIAGEAQRTDITGQLVAYATAKGDFKLGATSRTLFTTAATKHLMDPDTPLLTAFTRAQEEMRAATNTARPLLSTSLNGDIYLGRPSPTRKLEALVVTAGSADDDDTDADAWEAMLREAGFAVHRLVNPSHGQFDKGLSDFLGQEATGSPLQNQARIAPTALPVSSGPESDTLYFFVFVGEAASVKGQTWLGFSDTATTDFEGTAVNLDAVASALASRAAASVLVVDAAFTLSTGGASIQRNS